MPVYNAEQYLARAIDSIIAQTFKDWELILIDDGSRDDIMSVLSIYDDERIYYVKNPVNMGLIKTLNRGIDYCESEYIARMDADDIAHPDRLKHQVDFMDKHPQHLMCGTNAVVIDNNEQETGRIRNLTGNNFLQINLLFSPPFVHPSVIIRTEILQANRYDERYKHVEDYELWCRIARIGKVANIGKALLLYRWHDSNVSVLNSEAQDILKDKIIANELSRFDLEPTEEELYCHKITFNLYQLGKKKDIDISRFEDISNWFSKLLEKNKAKSIYKQSDFIAFLWARWIVLCVSQKKYSKALSPRFRSFNPSVLIKLLRLTLFLRKKQ